VDWHLPGIMPSTVPEDDKEAKYNYRIKRKNFGDKRLDITYSGLNSTTY
jgi:hypothetical protein